jgi:hypothetical protein
MQVDGPPVTVDLTQKRGSSSTQATKDGSSKYFEGLAQLMTTFTIDQSNANANINKNLSQLAESIHHVVHGLKSPREPIPITTDSPSGPLQKKWYAVVIGRTPGVYNSIKQLFNQIQGFKELFYRVFDTKPEADAWLASELLEFADMPYLIPR